ncbi:hypothetical protein Vretimale_13665, partial [Volvox reticuliferus]
MMNESAAVAGPGGFLWRQQQQVEHSPHAETAVSPFATPAAEEGKEVGGTPNIIVSTRHAGARQFNPRNDPNRMWAEAEEEAETEAGHHVGTVAASTSWGLHPFGSYCVSCESPDCRLSGGGSRGSGSSDGAGTSAYMTSADKYDNTNIGILPPLPFPLPFPPWSSARGSVVEGLGHL